MSVCRPRPLPRALREPVPPRLPGEVPHRCRDRLVAQNPLALMLVYLVVRRDCSGGRLPITCLYLLAGLTCWPSLDVVRSRAVAPRQRRADPCARASSSRSVVATQLVTFTVMLAILVVLARFIPTRGTVWMPCRSPRSSSARHRLRCRRARSPFRDIEHILPPRCCRGSSRPCCGGSTCRRASGTPRLLELPAGGTSSRRRSTPCATRLARHAPRPPTSAWSSRRSRSARRLRLRPADDRSRWSSGSAARLATRTILPSGPRPTRRRCREVPPRLPSPGARLSTRRLDRRNKAARSLARKAAPGCRWDSAPSRRSHRPRPRSPPRGPPRPARPGRTLA